MMDRLSGRSRNESGLLREGLVFSVDEEDGLGLLSAVVCVCLLV